MIRSLDQINIYWSIPACLLINNDYNVSAKSIFNTFSISITLITQLNLIENISFWGNGDRVNGIPRDAHPRKL